MSDVDRLEAELALAKLCETLEVARDALHASRTPKTIARYKQACKDVVAARSSLRDTYRVPTGPGDAAPAVGTVALKAGAHL